MNVSGDSERPDPTGTAVRVLLLVNDPALRAEWVGLLHALGYTVVEDGTAGQGSRGGAPLQTDLILLLAPNDDELSAEFIREMSQGEYPPPVVVFGSPTQEHLAKSALQAGAFAYLSLGTSRVEKGGVLAAAVRYREAQMQIQMLLQEAERVCSDLLGSFGHTSEKLQQTVQEVHKAQKALQGVQVKIIKAFV